MSTLEADGSPAGPSCAPDTSQRVVIPGLAQKDSTASFSGAFLGVSILHPCHSQGVPVTLITSILPPLSPMVILVLPTPGPSLPAMSSGDRRTLFPAGALYVVLDSDRNM